MPIVVSEGNKKLGKTPNISLPPGKSCRPGVPCFKEGCYAQKFYRMYPEVKRAWDTNWRAWTKSPRGYFTSLRIWIQEHPKTRRFRFHVGGDIPNGDYYNWMCTLASIFPRVAFLAFTKCYSYARSERPTNLTLVFSRWPGYPCPDLGDAPQAWMLDEKRKDVYIPKNAKTCPGSCVTCSRCFNMKPSESVVFHKH